MKSGPMEADDPRLALVYSEALRALERQQQTLSEFATRSGNLLFTAAIVTAFLGGIALQDEMPTTWSWIAVAALAGVGAVHVSILWPRWTWRFRFQPQELLMSHEGTSRREEVAQAAALTGARGSPRLAPGGRLLDPRLERGVHLLEPYLGLC
jgi:hypothetical protein